MNAGAIDVATGAYTLPSQATKNRNYICADCRARVVFRKGDIRVAHFAHWSGTNCGYYEHPSESQVHKDAKLRLAEILKNKKEITLHWECNVERCQGGGIGERTFACTDGDEVVLEYRGPNGTWPLFQMVASSAFSR
jgi:Competence protein CoiA-like family